MKKLKFGLLALFALVGVATFVPATTAYADPLTEVNKGLTDIGAKEPTNAVPLQTRIKQVINVIMFILGRIAVIMIIIGGIRYVVSGGDSGAVTSAKNTIFYAVIGLVVALLAYAIVNFVVSSFVK
jgi:hypothetical protein